MHVVFNYYGLTAVKQKLS